MKSIISTKFCPAAIGPYSQGIISGNFIFASGQLGIDSVSGNIVEGGIEQETIQILENIKNLLKSCEMGLEDVIKTTVFITNMNDFLKVNEIYSKYFNNNPPARSCIEVSRLPKGGLIEIEIIAHR